MISSPRGHRRRCEVSVNNNSGVTGFPGIYNVCRSLSFSKHFFGISDVLEGVIKISIYNALYIRDAPGPKDTGLSMFSL